MSKIFASIVVYLTFLIGFIITTIPWDAKFVFLRPYWILALLLVWTVKDPRRVGYITALVLGVLADSISGSQLGEHAIAFLIVTFLNRRFIPLYNSIGYLFQFICVILFTFVYSIIIFVLELFSYNFIKFDLEFFIPILTTALFWAWLMTAVSFMQGWLHRKFRIKIGK
ncbi:rod shape-determining protein MreD [Psittacicella hinzii]|nr:rod shape-determining protein MreD [Psittacicella hinzii]